MHRDAELGRCQQIVVVDVRHRTGQFFAFSDGPHEETHLLNVLSNIFFDCIFTPLDHLSVPFNDLIGGSLFNKNRGLIPLFTDSVDKGFP